ncbi:MAG: hypothetical protein H6R23_1333 [Proteobacteria bacterium]|nr:hypothetical protein [Pseudomonadota bacterium]
MKPAGFNLGVRRYNEPAIPPCFARYPRTP